MLNAQPLPEQAGAEVDCTGPPPPRVVSAVERGGREAPFDPHL